jgi:hypothetical protein
LPNPGANPGRRGGKPATNRFSYGAALVMNMNTKIDTEPRPSYQELISLTS